MAHTNKLKTGIAQIAGESMERCEFMNPISKSTFEALPKIYGYKKKKRFVIKYSPSPRTQQSLQAAKQTQLPKLPQQHAVLVESSVKIIKQLNQLSSRRHRTQPKRYNKNAYDALSQPKQQKCYRKYCFCSKQHDNRDNTSLQQSKKRELKINSVRLAELNTGREPDDLQTKHKIVQNNHNIIQSRHTIIQAKPHLALDKLRVVSRMNEEDSQSAKSNMNLLDLLRNNQFQQNQRRSRMNKLHQVQLQRNEVQSQLNLAQSQPNQIYSQRQHNNKSSLKDVHVQTQSLQNDRSQSESQIINKRNTQPLPILSNTKHQQQRESQSIVQTSNYDQDARLRFEQLKANRRHQSDEQEDQDDNKSVTSSLSSLQKYIFRGQHDNTMFHSLKAKSSQSEAYSSKSQIVGRSKQQQKYKKNGLFVIPEQDQYVDYLKSYQPMGKHFKIKKLVQKQHFQVVKSEDGVFFGQVKNQQKHGKGIMVSQKHIFEGNYQQNLKTFGCEKNVDGVYRGQFVNGLRQGYGTFEWYNGETFEGQWRNGTKNGFGIWKSPRGDFYEGEWRLNRQHGKGLYKHRLSTYRGEFKQFLKHGQGEQIFANGDRYQGCYIKGKPHGKGIYKWVDGSYYEGEFLGGLRQGKGLWHQSNGVVYQGQFQKDFKQGEGRQSYPSGECFVGQFMEGARLRGEMIDSKGKLVQKIS